MSIRTFYSRQIESFFIVILITFVTNGQAVNVKEFGARGDGVHNDSPAIQKAIDSLGVNGGTVFVPGGRYLLDANGKVEVNTAGHKYVHYGIRLPDNVVLEGAGAGVTVFIAHYGSEVDYKMMTGNRYSAIAVVKSENVMIEKLGIKYLPMTDKKESERTLAGHAGAIDLRHSKNVTIRDCKIDFAPQGITMFFGNSDILVDSVHIIGGKQGGCGIGIYGSLGRITVANCVILDCSDGMLSAYANPKGNILFTGNSVRVTPQNRRGDKCTQLISVEMSRFVKVVNNHLEGGYPGIDIKRSRASVITGNTFKNCYDGITVRAGDHAGVAAYSFRTIVSNNNMTDFYLKENGPGCGIRISAAANAIVTGNMVNGVRGVGIAVSQYAEYRTGKNWLLSGRGIVVANNVIIRRLDELAKDQAVASVVYSKESTMLEKWDAFDRKGERPEGVELIAFPGISIGQARNAVITGNVIRGGKARKYYHDGGVSLRKCENFTFSGNSIGDGNLGRGVLIVGGSGTVNGNSIEAGYEFAIRMLGDCRLISVTGNNLSYRSEKGAAIWLSGIASAGNGRLLGIGTPLDKASGVQDCVISGNTIFSEGELIFENYDNKKELSNRNIFTSNCGISLIDPGKSVRILGPDSIVENNIFRRKQEVININQGEKQ